MASVSTLETLPDELLLEVCKYLLCIDILQSFFGLNGRMTRLIKNYRTHVSLHKGSFAQCDYMYANIFPKIGSHIRTLVIDRLYSVLQVNMFNRCFNDQRLSNICPRLEKMTLVAFRQGELLPFVKMLEGFENLTELNIRSLFLIPLEHQPTVLEALLKVNNQKIRSVSISHSWSCLRLDKLSNVSYSNIIHLQIMIEKFDDFLLLFSVIPNVSRLYVTLTDNSHFISLNSETPSLIHLTNFRLVSVNRIWLAEELIAFLNRISSIQYLSLHLLTFDTRLVNGEQILALRQSLSQLQQFNYGVYYIDGKDNFDRQTILASWPPSSIECLVDETSYADRIFAFIHTLPYYGEPSTSVAFPAGIISKTMSVKEDDNPIEQLHINNVSTLAGCWPLMRHWRRVKELMIGLSTTDPTAPVVTDQQQQQQQQHTLMLPKLSRLEHLMFGGSIPSDLDHFSGILIAAPNLIRLDMSFDFLLPLLDNEEVNHLFQQRIRALCINKISSSTATAIDEHHIPRIRSTFSRLRHMFVDLTHLLPTMDSMMLCILVEFKERLVSLCADGKPSDEMKTDARKWLEDNNNKSNMNIVHPTEFDASFNLPSNRLLIWM